MSKRWRYISHLSVLTCLLFVGCGQASNEGAIEQPQVESSQIDEMQQNNVPEKEIATQEENDEKRYLNDLQPPEGIDYVIGDEYFVQDTDEIYINLEDYVGKTLQYEGMVTQVDAGRTAIIRLYDMEHEDHAHEIFVGLDAIYSGTWPKEKTWVRVTGTIEKNETESESEIYPILKVLTLEEIPAGQEKVYN